MVEKKRSKNNFSAFVRPRVLMTRCNLNNLQLGKENAIPHCSKETVQNYFNVAAVVKEEPQPPCIFHTEVDLQDDQPAECSRSCTCGDCLFLLENKERTKQALLAQIAKKTLENMPPLRKITPIDLLHHELVPTSAPVTVCNAETQTPAHELKYKCKLCHSEFSNSEFLKHHQSVHYTTQYGCVYCTATFYSKPKLLRHVFYHVNKNFYTCTHCEATFARKSALRKHISAHENKTLMTCNRKHCAAKFDKKFDFENHLRRHESNSTGTLVHVFRKDKSNAISGGEATTEAVASSTDVGGTINTGFYACTKCRKLSFRTLALLKKHEGIHTRKSGMYTCPTCRAQFTSKVRLTMHRNHAH